MWKSYVTGFGKRGILVASHSYTATKVAAKFSYIKTNSMKGYHSYQSCVDTCLHCAAICNHCASACLQEDDVKMMARCIQLDMECAAVCYAAAQVMSIGGQTAEQLCQICADVCDACGAECAQHENDHCQECAKVCHQCAEECRHMAGATA
jgi:hypothetical protein